MRKLDLSRLTESVHQRGRPYRVLIVDDEPWVREVFKDFCELTDAVEVEMAAGGADAIDRLSASEFDLVALDLIMPEMSGLEVLTSIKKNSPKTPVMIITGNATDKIINQAGVLGACRVIMKPVVLEHFVSELTSALVR